MELIKINKVQLVGSQGRDSDNDQEAASVSRLATPLLHRPAAGTKPVSLQAFRLLAKCEVFLKKEQVVTVLMNLLTWDGCLPQPAIHLPKALWTDKLIFSMVLRSYIRCTQSIHPDDENEGLYKWIYPADTKVLVEDGQLVFGTLCKNLAAGSCGSLRSIVYLEEGLDQVGELYRYIQTVASNCLLIKDSTKSAKERYTEHAGWSNHGDDHGDCCTNGNPVKPFPEVQFQSENESDQKYRSLETLHSVFSIKLRKSSTAAAHAIFGALEDLYLVEPDNSTGVIAAGQPAVEKSSADTMSDTLHVPLYGNCVPICEEDRSHHYKSIDARDETKLVQPHKGAWAEFDDEGDNKDCSIEIGGKGSEGKHEHNGCKVEDDGIGWKVNADVKELEVEDGGKIWNVQDKGKVLEVVNDGKGCKVREGDKGLDTEGDTKRWKMKADVKGLKLEDKDNVESKKTVPKHVPHNKYKKRKEDTKPSFLPDSFRASVVCMQKCYSIYCHYGISLFLILAFLIKGCVHGFNGPTNEVVKRGGHAVLTCYTDFEYPVKWFINQRLFYSGYSFAADVDNSCYTIDNWTRGYHNLIINNAHEKMAGFYTCQQVCDVKSGTSRLIVLDVNCNTEETSVTTAVCTAVITGGNVTSILWRIIDEDSVINAIGAVTLNNSYTVDGIRRQAIRSELNLTGNDLHMNRVCSMTMVFNDTDRPAIILGLKEQMADNIPTYVIEFPCKSSKKVNNSKMSCFFLLFIPLVVVVTISCYCWKHQTKTNPPANV